MHVELVCRSTGERFSADDPRWQSPAGGLLDLDFTPAIDPDQIRKRPATMWRYREALPIAADTDIVTLGEGFTPLQEAEFDGRRVWLKHEHLSPSGSYKDRGASVLVSKAHELGVTRVIEDSSGNAGAAIAAYCAQANIACDIYVPASTSAGKLAQILATGAALHPIPGSREETARTALAAAREAYYASHVWNPYFFEGTKTFAYEVVEQLGWRAPGAVVIPTGNGTLLIGAFRGFRELRAAGIIDRLPRLYAIQAENCAPLCMQARVEAAKEGSKEVAAGVAPAPTIAEGIAIAEPMRAEQCIEAVRATGGRFMAVAEAQIKHAWRAALARGWCIEPTSAAALAALEQIDDAGTIIVPLTGHGLKVGAKLG